MTVVLKDIFWAAGIMEGEGYFGLRRGRDLVAQLAMTDKDVVDKFQSIFGFGSRKERPLPSGKIAHCWLVTNQTDAAGFMMTLLPLMGGRRAEKIKACIAAWREKPLRKKMWTHCKSGHELAGKNLKTNLEGKYTKRRCIECGKLRQRKYRANLANASGIFTL